MLHIIFSSVLSSRNARDFDLKISLPSADLNLLQALIRSCRRLGMFHYPTILSRYKETDLVTFVWVSIEEIKRFSIALYKICEKLNINDGPKGTGVLLLNASELQFPLPKNCPLWNAAGKEEWILLSKDEEVVSVNDSCQEAWISNSAELFQMFEL